MNKDTPTQIDATGKKDIGKKEMILVDGLYLELDGKTLIIPHKDSIPYMMQRWTFTIEELMK